MDDSRNESASEDETGKRAVPRRRLRFNSDANSLPVVEPEQGNGQSSFRGQDITSSETKAVLSHIIGQLRPGADLSRVTLPTFILEPRSMLERITKFVEVEMCRTAANERSASWPTQKPSYLCRMWMTRWNDFFPSSNFI